MPTNRSYRTTRRTGTRTTNRTTRTTTSTTRNATNPAYPATKFSNQRQKIAAAIGSFRTIGQQFNGPGRVVGFSPAAANRWINFVNNGARVYKFSNTQVDRLVGTTGSTSTTSTTNVLRSLQRRFGNGIKAVTQVRGNNWLVAATPSVTARPFTNYNWR